MINAHFTFAYAAVLGLLYAGLRFELGLGFTENLGLRERRGTSGLV